MRREALLALLRTLASLEQWAAPIRETTLKVAAEGEAGEGEGGEGPGRGGVLRVSGFREGGFGGQPAGWAFGLDWVATQLLHALVGRCVCDSSDRG